MIRRLLIVGVLFLSCSVQEHCGKAAVSLHYIPPRLHSRSVSVLGLPAGSAMVIVTITGTGFDPIVQELSVASHPSGATIGNIPAGENRSVSVVVQDMSGVILARGKTTGVMIHAGSVNPVDILITQVGMFTQLKTKVIPRAFAVASPLPGGTALIMGGMTAQPSACGSGCVQLAATRATEIYDPGTGTFVQGPDMNEPRVFFTANVLADGSIVVIGGSDRAQVSCTVTACSVTIPDNHVKNSIEVFDPVSKSFYKTQALAVPRAGHTSDKVGDYTLLVAGGTGGSGPLATAEIIDTRMGSDVMLSMAAARMFQTSVVYGNGTLFLAGGTVTTGQAEFFQSSVFTVSNAMTCPAYFPSSVFLDSEGIAVLNGGIDADLQPVAGFMIVDPVKQIVLSYHSMPLPRAFLSDVILGDGNILIAGGITSADFKVSGSAEIFNPGIKSFVQRRVLTSERAGYAAQGLENGAALVVSGFSNINPLAGTIAIQDTAELYNP